VSFAIARPSRSAAVSSALCAATIVLAITPAIATHAARFVVLNELDIIRYLPVTFYLES
jgi:hypothetical protein